MTSLTAERLLIAFSDPGNKQEAIRLLSALPDQSEIKNIKNSSWYLIHLAAYNGWTDIVELLVTTYHCDPNYTTSGGRTSLHLACETNQLPTVNLLTTEYCLNPLQATSSGVWYGGYGYRSTPLDYSSGETRQFLQQIIGKCVLCLLLV